MTMRDKAAASVEYVIEELLQAVFSVESAPRLYTGTETKDVGPILIDLDSLSPSYIDWTEYPFRQSCKIPPCNLR
jgi:hypothetical protein